MKAYYMAKHYIKLPLWTADFFLFLYKNQVHLGYLRLLYILTGIYKLPETLVFIGVLRNIKGQIHVAYRAILCSIRGKSVLHSGKSMQLPLYGVKICSTYYK